MHICTLSYIDHCAKVAKDDGSKLMTEVDRHKYKVSLNGQGQTICELTCTVQCSYSICDILRNHAKFWCLVYGGP